MGSIPAQLYFIFHCFALDVCIFLALFLSHVRVYIYMCTLQYMYYSTCPSTDNHVHEHACTLYALYEPYMHGGLQLFCEIDIHVHGGSRLFYRKFSNF